MAEIVFEVHFESKWLTREVVPLSLSFYRIGRSPECEIYLDWWLTRTLSAFQASLYEMPQTMRRSAGYAIRDGIIGKPSTNGCFINGKKVVNKTRLFHQDAVLLAPGLRMVYLNPSELRVSDQMEATLSDNTEALVNLAT